MQPGTDSFFFTLPTFIKWYLQFDFCHIRIEICRLFLILKSNHGEPKNELKPQGVAS